jgi:hypothetical protein
VAATLGLTACSDDPSPEQQVRAVVDAAEAAAERRDHSELMALVAADFRGARGEDAQEVSRILRGYLIAHPKIEVTTRIEALEFPYEDLARARVNVGTLGRGRHALEIAAEAQVVELELQRRDGDWRVTRAEWD